MTHAFIDPLLERNIKHGTLIVRSLEGKEVVFGQGSPKVTWVLHKPGIVSRIARNSEMELGETYMNGDWDIEDASLEDLLALLCNNISQKGLPAPIRGLIGLWQHWNRIKASYANVSHHYELDQALFRDILDSEMHYSCAYFERENISLDKAQRAKCRHIMAKLCLKPGQRILDIGCGWGGLALYLAEQCDVLVTGLTVSEEQRMFASQRAADRGLTDRVNFQLADYRQHQGSYDRIVSVGMFEHVGRRHFRTFFDRIYQLLNGEGVALIHTIGRDTPPALTTNLWIRRYIFPGGYIPALSEIMPSIEGSGLALTDIEILRRHYALTLEAWNRRFQKQRESWVRTNGERFCRMWEYYLTSCAVAFRYDNLVVFQLQLAKNRDALPIIRNYQYERN